MVSGRIDIAPSQHQGLAPEDATRGAIANICSGSSRSMTLTVARSCRARGRDRSSCATLHMLRMGSKRLDFPQVLVTDADAERLTKMRA